MSMSTWMKLYFYPAEIIGCTLGLILICSKHLQQIIRVMGIFAKSWASSWPTMSCSLTECEPSFIHISFVESGLSWDLTAIAFCCCVCSPAASLKGETSTQTVWCQQPLKVNLQLKKLQNGEHHHTRG